MEIVTIKLISPIQFGGETIKELKLRPAKARDLRDIPFEPKVGDLLNVAAKLSGQPPSVIDDLDPEDLAEVMEVVGKFMNGGRRTGANLSAA